jgi:PAS domain-containing protein
MDHAIVHHLIGVLAATAPPALVGVLAGLGAAALLLRLRRVAAGPPDSDAAALLAEPRELVFREGYLVDHSDGVGLLLPGAGGEVDRLAAWDTVRQRLDRLVPGAAAALDGLAREGRSFRLEGCLAEDRLVALGVRRGRDLSVTLSAASATRPAIRVPVATLRAMEEEAELLIGAASGSPALSWAVDAAGRVVWGNPAYLDALRLAQGPSASAGWPLPALFPDDTPQRAGTWRRNVHLGTREAWYEITATERSGWTRMPGSSAPLPAGPAADGAAPGEGREAADLRVRFLHAQPIDRTVEVEGRLRRFIQSMTGAFAELPGGLALFDDDDRLLTFNPAFGDIAGLSPSWMAGRPDRQALCEALCAQLRLPQDALAPLARAGEVEGEAERGATELSLVDGRALRLSWRLRPDDTLVLRLDDMTEERRAARQDARRSLTSARGRTLLERETAERLAGAGGRATAVFEADGAQVFSTPAMSALWGLDGAHPPATLEGWLALWTREARSDPAWARLRGPGQRGPSVEAWHARIGRRGGRSLELTVRPLPGDRTAITFEPAAPPRLPELVPAALTRLTEGNAVMGAGG